jgi:hypothetical protein
MSITRTLSQTVAWAQTFTQMTPIIGVAGFVNEPALTICNNLKQQLIQKPYNWKFNQSDSAPFLTVASAGIGSNPCPLPTPPCPSPCSGTTCIPTTDYQIGSTDIGWIEAAWRIDILNTAVPQPLDNVEVVRVLRPTSQVADPEKLAFMYENNDGGIVRLWPMPSIAKQWQIGFTYQRKANPYTGLEQTWAPFPDDMAWVINLGFMAEAYRHANDARFPEADAKFRMAIMQYGSFADAEGNSEAFQPDHGLFLG